MVATTFPEIPVAEKRTTQTVRTATATSKAATVLQSTPRTTSCVPHKQHTSTNNGNYGNKIILNSVQYLAAGKRCFDICPDI